VYEGSYDPVLLTYQSLGGLDVIPQVLATGWTVSLDLIEQCLVMIMSLDHNIGMVTSELKPLLFEVRPNLIFVK
jgi:hypothetical protein